MQKSQMHELTLATLASMDGGRIGEAFQLALKRALTDCDDRPGVSKPRVITLQVAVVPVSQDGAQNCEEVRLQAVISDAVPKRQTKAYSMRVKHGGRAAFNDESLDNVDQLSLGLDSDEE